MATREETLAEIARLRAEAEQYAQQAESLRNGEIHPDDVPELIDDETDDDAEDESEPNGDENLWDGTPMGYQKRVYPPEPPPSDKRTKDLAKNSGRRCTAHRKNGAQCRKWAIYGTNVCDTHGGRAPQTKAKALQRLAEAAPRVAERLIGLAENNLKDGTKVGAYAQVQAANSVLDRVGITAPKEVTVTVTPFESILSDIENGSRDAYRRSIGDERAGELPAFGEIESPPPGPGGPRVIGQTFDGHDVIEGELVELGDSAEHRASVGQGSPGQGYPHDDGHDGAQGRRETLGNYSPTLRLPNGGYMPTEQAMEQAAEQNRLSKRNLGRL